jgi:DNA transformation protein and related proteins
MSSPKKASELRQLRNIGPILEELLREAGITTCRQLKKAGAAKAFEKIRECYPQRFEKPLPVTRVVLSLQGALLNLHWSDIPERTRQRLLREVSQD